MRNDTSSRNVHVLKESVKLVVIADGQDDVSRDDAFALVGLRAVSCNFHDLCCNILHDSCQKDGRFGGHSFCVSSLFHAPLHASDGEDDTCLCGPG